MEQRKSLIIVPENQNLVNPNSKYNVLAEEEQESLFENTLKLLFLILLTFGLMVSMWVTCQAIYYQNNNSITQSYQDGSGLLFGLFIFYLLCFGVAWYWGYGQRQELKLRVVEKEIAKKRAQQALANME